MGTCQLMLPDNFYMFMVMIWIFPDFFELIIYNL